MSSQRRQKFEVGDCVETSKGEKCIIHFIGKVNGLCHNNILYGIEYIDGTIGEHNGKYKGKKYFIGLPKRCSFIKYDQIRRKTKYYAINNGTHSPKHHFKKSNSVKNKCKSIRSIHSNNIFTKDYIYKSHTENEKYKTPTLSNSKRKSLPTTLNDTNKLKNRKKNDSNLKRRSSASNKNKNKNKYLLHLEQLQQKNEKKYPKKIRNSTTNILNTNKKIRKYKSNIKTRTMSTHNTLKTNTKTKIIKLNKSEIQKQMQKRRNANGNIEIKRNKKRTNKKHNKNMDECSIYKNERIHFSEMNMLDLVDGNQMNLENILAYDSIEEKELKKNNINMTTTPTPTLKTENSKRKNAFSNIILSQDSLNEYHLKRNLVIGDIYIGNKYLLKNGKYGICLYVGPVHWIDHGKNTVENEYIGIALLEKGAGKHDGEYKGKRYFQCQKRCGIFVKRNKLWKDCGPVTQEEIDMITRRRIKRGGLLYDSESDISELSDNNNGNDIYAMESDSDYTHSGHSDLEDNNSLLNNSLDVDDIDDTNDDIVSYINIFSPQTVECIENDIIITPVQYISDNEKKNMKTKKKSKRKSKTRQCRSVSADQYKKPCVNTLKGKRKSISRSVKNKSKKSSKSCVALEFKNGKNNCKKWKPQTPKIDKKNKIEKQKESKTKRKKRVNILGDNNEINNNKHTKSTKFPFDNNNNKKNEIIEYKPVLTKKRTRRNATPIVSIPNLIGQSNFISFLNEIDTDGKDERNDINDFSINLNSKSLTPLQSQN